MAQRVISDNTFIQTVSYALPNKHYIPVDMRYLEVDNLTPLSNISIVIPVIWRVI